VDWHLTLNGLSTYYQNHLIAIPTPFDSLTLHLSLGSPTLVNLTMFCDFCLALSQLDFLDSPSIGILALLHGLNAGDFNGSRLSCTRLIPSKHPGSQSFLDLSRKSDPFTTLQMLRCSIRNAFVNVSVNGLVNARHVNPWSASARLTACLMNLAI